MLFLQTALSDYCGYMMLSNASLAALNQRLDSPVPISNFRANIIVEGCQAFEEVGSLLFFLCVLSVSVCLCLSLSLCVCVCVFVYIACTLQNMAHKQNITEMRCYVGMLYFYWRMLLPKYLRILCHSQKKCTVFIFCLFFSLKKLWIIMIIKTTLKGAHCPEQSKKKKRRKDKAQKKKKKKTSIASAVCFF